MWLLEYQHFELCLIMWPNKAQLASTPAVVWLLQGNRINIKVGSNCKRTLKANLNYLEFSRLPNYGFLAKLLLFKKVSWYIRCNQILFTAGKQLERYFSCLEIQEKTSACRKPKFKIWIELIHYALCWSRSPLKPILANSK